MEFKDKVIWSERSFSIYKVITGQAKVDFPLLVKVTEGFYGNNEEETVATDQVWFYDIHRIKGDTKIPQQWEDKNMLRNIGDLFVKCM